jgi:CHAT domain-containing protein
LSLMGAMGRADQALGAAQVLAGSEIQRDPLTVERIALTRERLSDPDEAKEQLAHARKGYEAAGDAAGVARTEVYRRQILARESKSSKPLDGLDALVDASRDPEARARLYRYQAEAAYHERGFARCEELAEKAVKLADKRGVQPVAKLARVALALCAAETDHLETAIRSAEEAGFLTEEQRQHLTGDQAREEAGFEAFQIYRLLLSLQVRLPESERAAAAFVTMERARARAHLDAVARGRLGATGPLGDVSSMLERDKEAAEDRLRRLTKELTRARKEPGLGERHKDALWALEDIKEAMRQENPLLARIAVPEPVSIDGARKAVVGDATLLVSYFMAEEQAIAIAIDKDGQRLAVLPATPERLGKLVRGFRREVLLAPGKDQPAVKAAAAALYKEILAPFDDLLAKRKNLVVIPHGALSSLPFEALVGKDGKFVVEGHDVSYSLSATLGVELAKQKRASTEPRRAFVGMGDPVYDWTAFRGGQAEGGTPAASRGLELWNDAAAVAEAAPAQSGSGLARLPGTGAELKAIAKLFGQDQRLYLREQATEENVKSGGFSKARIVHVASHGLLEPHYQALALSLVPESKEDGFLLHSEIVDLDLDADLVVLSACQTGNTRFRSAEPVAGLALALRNAGAARVVVSLWSVDDEATARLMTDFYRPLVKEGASYRAALSEAKRQMIARGPAHPFFWAPFVLLGE